MKLYPAWLSARAARFRYALRARLLGLFLVLALAVSLAFLGGMQASFGSSWRCIAKPLVTDYLDKLSAEVGSPPSIERAHALTQKLPIAVRIEGPIVNWDSAQAEAELSGDDPRAAKKKQEWQYRTDWNEEEPDDKVHFLRRQTADGHSLYFSISVDAWQKQPTYAAWISLALTLLFTALAYFLIRRWLSPLEDIRAGSARFGQGRFDSRIPIKKKDELGDLAASINQMAVDLEKMLEAKRGLLLAISHELRSPLTRAKLHAEMLSSQAPTGETRDALIADLNLMRDLISDLMETERLSMRHHSLQRERCDVASLVHDVLDQLHFERPVKLEIDVREPVDFLDPMRFKLMLRNLLSNAQTHAAQADRPIELHLFEDSGALCLALRDYGPGVDEAVLPMLTEPFYRPDQSRTRSSGGVGLGLYLVQLIVRAHSGSLEIKNANPGLLVKICLPKIINDTILRL